MDTREIGQIPNTRMMAWTPNEVGQQVNAIQYLMSQNMTEGEHWGKIPGCGDKPALLKPGAEKLGLMFRLAAKYETVEDKMPNGHIDVKTKCSLYHINTGAFWGEGLGSCSTMESKYRYRAGAGASTGVQVPKDYWNLKTAGKFKEAQEKLGGSGYGTAKLDPSTGKPDKETGTWFIVEKVEKAENPDIADTYNTVRKISKKRAFVDAMLSSTAASDIFTQDIDETLPTPEKKEEPKKPQILESDEAQQIEQRFQNSLGSFVSPEEQKEIMFQIKNKRIDKDAYLAYLKTFGASGTKEIPKDRYNSVISWIIQNEPDAING